MSSNAATAIAHPNIAFIKYWGNRDDTLRLPSNGSISMNLGGLDTRTSVAFDTRLSADELTINGMPSERAALDRVRQMLEAVRRMAGISIFAQAESENNFPTGAGIASSASAFAALALAATKAAGLNLTEADLSRLARSGSGSACRSVPGGFVEWNAGSNDSDSYAFSIASPDHWDLADCIVIINAEHKITGSTQGNSLAGTSLLQAARVEDAPRRLEICRKAILARDFDGLAAIVELDSNLLHAIMMTSSPALFYWQPATLTVMETVRMNRSEGLPVCYSIDAGPNVHLLTPAENAQQVEKLMLEVPGVQDVCVASVGGPAKLV